MTLAGRSRVAVLGERARYTSEGLEHEATFGEDSADRIERALCLLEEHETKGRMGMRKGHERRA